MCNGSNVDIKCTNCQKPIHSKCWEDMKQSFDITDECATCGECIIFEVNKDENVQEKPTVSINDVFMGHSNLNVSEAMQESHRCYECNSMCHAICGRIVTEGFGGKVICTKCDQTTNTSLQEKKKKEIVSTNQAETTLTY